MSRIYVASSWRCRYQMPAVLTLRIAGFEVYDFRNPGPGTDGFSWKTLDGGWQSWSVKEYVRALQHPVAQEGFRLDRAALEGADVVVLVLPSGRSAHVEAAWAKGRGARVYVWSPVPCEPELMYLLFDGVTDSMHELLGWLGVRDADEVCARVAHNEAERLAFGARR